jgi:tight adherence protein C
MELFGTTWTLEELILAGLVFVAVMSIGGALFTAIAYRRRSLTPRLRELDISAPHAKARSKRGSQFEIFERIGSAVSGAGSSLRLKRELAKAGYFSPAAASTFLGIKMLLLTAGLGIGLAIIVMTDLTLMVATVIGLWVAAFLFFLPNVVVRLRQKKRSLEVQTYLPDAIDLLEVCVSSGMGLDMAWNAVTDEIRRVSTVLADEMALTTLEFQLGATRAEAMRHMAQRTDAEEMSSLVAMLVQSERFGASISDTLRTFATSIREMRSQRAEERAEKMAVKLLFPMVLCIFPAMLIVMVGPAAITIFRTIGQG